MIKKIDSNSILLLLIIGVGTFLRLFHLNEMPFMHDEFSALFRTRFDTLNEVLNIGVRIGDTHPAGIQVFLWWLVALVGENELYLKVPFVLMGILSIPLIYKIGSLWFNKNVGLISAAFIASVQYSLTYSVIIRPYISGLFLGLMMVYFWTQIIKGKQSLFVYLGYVVFATLSAYNHHFSLLFTFVVGISGIFILKKQFLLKYVTAGCLVFILYIPHLSIFFYQLNKGGLDGWLSAPTLLFPLNYVKYIFHFSIVNYLLAIVIFFIGLLNLNNSKLNHFYKLSLVWFLFPIIIGLWYSLKVNPVIQYSMLIFTFPYFLFVIFGLYPEKISKRLTGLIVLLILLFNSFTLIQNRQHYRLVYQTRHLAYLNDINSFKEKKKSTILVANHPRIDEFYQNKYKWDFKYVNYLLEGSKDISLLEVQKLAKESKAPYFMYGGMSIAAPEIVQIIKKYYPYCIQKKDYFASNFYVFTKSSREDAIQPYFMLQNNFETKKPMWNNVDLVYNEKGAVLNSEWGPQIKFNLDSVLNHRNDVLDINVEFTAENNKDLYLVTEIKTEDSIVHYSAVSSKDFLKENNSNYLFKTVELSGVRFSNKNVEVSSYLWNKDGGKFELKNYTINLRPGNPVQYSLYEPILENYE